MRSGKETKTDQLYIQAAYQFTADKTNAVELHVRSVKDGWVPLDGCPLCPPPPPESDDVAAAPDPPTSPTTAAGDQSALCLHKIQQYPLQQNKPHPNQGNLHESLSNINNRPSPSLPPRPALKMTASASTPNPLSPATRRIGNMIRKM
jgi:hypothetical protein